MIDAIKAVKDGLAEDMAKDAKFEIQKIHDKFIKRLMMLY